MRKFLIMIIQDNIYTESQDDSNSLLMIVDDENIKSFLKEKMFLYVVRGWDRTVDK